VQVMVKDNEGKIFEERRRKERRNTNAKVNVDQRKGDRRTQVQTKRTTNK